jgi:hypothetical protein
MISKSYTIISCSVEAMEPIFDPRVTSYICHLVMRDSSSGLPCLFCSSVQVLHVCACLSLFSVLVYLLLSYFTLVKVGPVTSR